MRAFILILFTGLALPLVAKPETKRGIVLQVNAAGAVTRKDGKKLEGFEAVELFLKTLRQKMEKLGIQGYLSLAALEGTPFEHVRGVINSAAEAGLSEVKFVLPPTLRGTSFFDRELMFKSQFAAEVPRPKKGEPQPFFITIGEEGYVWANRGEAKEILDTDTTNSLVPILEQRLEIYSAAARLGGDVPRVQLYVEAKARYERVVHVLNSMSKQKIGSVRFLGSDKERVLKKPLRPKNRPVPLPVRPRRRSP